MRCFPIGFHCLPAEKHYGDVGILVKYNDNNTFSISDLAGLMTRQVGLFWKLGL